MTTCHRNLLVISLFLFSIFTTISSEINGRLFYLENDIEKPIIGATISLIGTTSGAISNTEGKFIRIHILPVESPMVVLAHYLYR